MGRMVCLAQEDDFARVLRELNRLAREGGVLFLKTPRFRQVLLYLLYAAGLTLEEIAPIVDFPLAELQALLARED
ncbi:hypothetical protein SAMN05920897_1482 [Alkalispirochaeta americana]|uniref:Uncharacterized protein n=1 Tax=Alkalispirochaeta americana TaxID=159291 RepID=A0A1N6YC81_9SPIO|nr:hypothetical protein [Alkalispirochaeta americana]SIR12184.1 hypothetical protein SAMN05920897_1482 [Alkalispirochaeta americana]